MKLSQIPRTTLAYVVAIVLLGVVLAVQETSSPRRNAIPIPAISEEVNRIVMEQEIERETDRESDGGQENRRLELYRESDGWRVREARDDASRSYRADTATVEALLRDVETLSAADVISTRANYEEYGLADGGTRRLRLFVDDIQPLAIEFGGTAAAGDAVYGRINGSREIVLLPRSLSSAVVTDVDELRDTAVVRLPEEQITQVEIRSPSHETLTLSRDRPGDSTAAAAEEGEAVWSVEREGESDSEGATVSSGRVRDLFAELNPLRAQQFLTDEPQGEPFAEIVIRRSGDRDAEEVRIWPPDADGRYPVRTTSAEEAVLIPEWRARRLLLGLERYFAPFTEDGQPAASDQAAEADRTRESVQPAAD